MIDAHALVELFRGQAVSSFEVAIKQLFKRIPLADLDSSNNPTGIIRVGGSTGTNNQQMKIPYSIQSAVATNSTAVLTEQVLKTISIPANAIGLNGRLRIRVRWTMTNNANVKTLGVKFGGTTFALENKSGCRSYLTNIDIMNRNSAAIQIGGALDMEAGDGASQNSFYTGTIATTSAQSLTIIGTLAVTTDVITVESYSVEVLYG